MENFFETDSSFELQSDLDGMELLKNRILTTMPSEKSSFQIDLGFDGYSNFEPPIDKTADKTKPKREYDPEKIAQGVTATAGALGSIVGTVQAFKGDGTKAPSRRRQLKDVCGRKPLLKKNRTEYDKCVTNFNAGNIGNVETRTQTTSDDTPPPPPPPPTDNKKRNIIIGVVVVAVLVTAFIGYKKGWFGKKA
jgi:hypothetical protein